MILRTPLRLAVLVSLFGMACSSSGRPGPEISTTEEPDVDFSALRTFDFTGQGDVQGITDDRLDQMRVAVEKALTAKGYARSSNAPDFLVEAFGALHEDMDEDEVKERYPSYFQREHEFVYTRTYTQVTTWEEGTLAIHVVDPDTERVIWAVTAEGSIQTSVNPEVMQERLDAGAVRLLEDFPAR